MVMVLAMGRGSGARGWWQLAAGCAGQHRHWEGWAGARLPAEPESGRGGGRGCVAAVRRVMVHAPRAG